MSFKLCLLLEFKGKQRFADFLIRRKKLTKWLPLLSTQRHYRHSAVRWFSGNGEILGGGHRPLFRQQQEEEEVAIIVIFGGRGCRRKRPCLTYGPLSFILAWRSNRRRIRKKKKKWNSFLTPQGKSSSPLWLKITGRCAQVSKLEMFRSRKPMTSHGDVTFMFPSCY